MDLKICEYTKDRLADAIDFELRLRKEEEDWGWEIDAAYIDAVTKSFEDRAFENSLSLLAYAEGKVIGRIDSAMVASRFDGSLKAYLDWICVVKSYRHRGVAQGLMRELRARLKEKGANTLMGLIAKNEGAQRFYRALEQTKIDDEGIWIDL